MPASPNPELASSARRPRDVPTPGTDYAPQAPGGELKPGDWFMINAGDKVLYLVVDAPDVLKLSFWKDGRCCSPSELLGRNGARSLACFLGRFAEGGAR